MTAIGLFQEKSSLGYFLEKKRKEKKTAELPLQ